MKTTHLRPKTIAEVANRTKEFGNFHAHLREFIDEFDKKKDVADTSSMFEEEPDIDDGVAKPFLAATTEYLCRKGGQRPPLWTNGADCFLNRPYFASPLQSHKALLLASSPAAFRRRMIFVESTPLMRPHAGNAIR